MAAGAAAVQASAGLMERLQKSGRVPDAQLRAAVDRARKHNEHILEALIASGAVGEEELLRLLAQSYRTRFVTTLRLARAQFDSKVLQFIPMRLCEQRLVFPILYDAKNQVLSVVLSDLDRREVIAEIKGISRVAQVRPYIARPAAIQAAIRKHFYQEPQAFAALGVSPASSPEDQLPALDTGFGTFRGGGGTGLSLPPGSSSMAPPKASIRAAPRPAPKPAPVISLDVPAEAAEFMRGKSSESERTEGADYLQAMNVMVTLLEKDRGELRGHSAQVARSCWNVCERLGLDAARAEAISLAAYLHDLGKSSTYHLTALNVAKYEGHRAQAQKTYLAPVRLFEGVRLPTTTIDTLSHVYERFDGSGFPDRLTGKDIPLGARLLAIAETFSDLASHEKNPYRRQLSAAEACDVVRQLGGPIFDLNLADMFRQVTLGADLRSQLMTERRTVLVVEPDAEDSTVLEMRLMEHGYGVAIARSASEALSKLRETGADVVVSESELSPFDGFELLQRMRDEGMKQPFVYLTTRSDRTHVTRGFDLGAADYVIKPASGDIVAAKIGQILSTRKSTRGVNGSLEEMGLPDVVQILANGRKTGKLSIQGDGGRGEVHFSEGLVFDARYGQLRGEDAFYAMLLLQKGDFVLDPSFHPTERVIESSAESLLLEGMRRLDEAGLS